MRDSKEKKIRRKEERRRESLGIDKLSKNSFVIKNGHNGS